MGRGASPRGDEGPEQCGIKPSPGQRLLGRCLRPCGTIPLSFLPGIPAAPFLPHLQSVPPPHTPRKFSLQELLQTGRLLPSPRRGKEIPRFHTHKHFPPQLRAGTAGGRARPCNKEVKRNYPGGAPPGKEQPVEGGVCAGETEHSPPPRGIFRQMLKSCIFGVFGAVATADSQTFPILTRSKGSLKAHQK